MRITLNLASRPYVDLRPLYTRLRLWMVLLAILAVPFFLLLRVEQRRASVAQAEQTRLTRDMQKLKQEQQNNQVQMRQPQNAAVLAQSEFLNQLFKRKTFSWTAVMMDLETVLPSGVQVMNLEPVIAPDGQVTIRMQGQRSARQGGGTCPQPGTLAPLPGAAPGRRNGGDLDRRQCRKPAKSAAGQRVHAGELRDSLRIQSHLACGGEAEESRFATLGRRAGKAKA